MGLFYFLPSQCLVTYSVEVVNSIETGGKEAGHNILKNDIAGGHDIN